MPLSGYKRTGTAHQIAVTLSPARTAFAGIALNRDRVDFAERDRLILIVLRPHLVRAYQNTRAFSEIRAEDLVRRTGRALK
jgi:hypothetical protein